MSFQTLFRPFFSTYSSYTSIENCFELIISNNDYNKIMGLFIVCPITNNTKYFPTHVNLDSSTMTTGCILCEHVKTLDLKVRKAKKKRRMSTKHSPRST